MAKTYIIWDTINGNHMPMMLRKMLPSLKNVDMWPLILFQKKRTYDYAHKFNYKQLTYGHRTNA